MPDKISKPDYRFKILYAVGMLLIVSGHCEHGGIDLFYKWFPPYSFHLGLFAFCSGYFFKEQAIYSVKTYCIKKVKRLLLPLYLWNAFYALLVLILEKWGFTITAGVSLHRLFVMPIINGHQFMYNLGGWFVIPLFMIQIFTVCVRYLLKNFESRYKEHFLFLFYLVLGFIGIQLANAGYIFGWWLALVRMLFFLPFFGAGIYYKNVLEKHDHCPNSLYFLVIFGIQLLIEMRYGWIPMFRPSWCTDFIHGPIVPYVVGFSCIAFWLRVARILEPAIGKAKIVNLIANNTFSIMINQLLGFMIVKAGFALLQLANIISDFDMYSFKTDPWYYYKPMGSQNSLIIYLIAGIGIPILMQIGIDRFKSAILRKTKRKVTNINC